MAASKKTAPDQPRPSKTELSRLLDEYLRRAGCNKAAVIYSMRPLRKVRPGKEHPAGKYFIKVSSGRATPNFDYLLEVVTAIKGQTGNELSSSEVALWLASWLMDYLQKYPKPTKTKSPHTHKDAAKREAAVSFVNKAISAAAGWQRRIDVGRGVDRDYPPTLREKEYILNNCVVIVGASVRHPPTSAEQLFRQNAQLSDLMYLPHLDLGPEPLLLTDNMIIALAESDRKELLGRKHLLVIGGPIVNVATRYLNNGSIFPFCLDEQKRRFDDVFDTLKGFHSLRNSQAVEMFYEMLRRPSAEVRLDSHPFIGRDVRKIWQDVERFRTTFGLDEDTVYEDILGWLTRVHSFYDPLTCRVVAPSRLEPNLGVISLGSNRWADDPHYICMTVAGLNPFGTVGALRALVYSTFNDRPCGGILNTAVPHESSEYLKFTDAEFDWITNPYGVADLKSRLERIQKDNRKSRPSYHAFHGEERYFSEYAEFVKSFKG